MSEQVNVRTRGRVKWVVLAGVVLPLIAASVAIWSVTDREDALDQVPVAIVNSDTILTDPQPMAAGRALAASLIDPTGSGPNLDWTLTDADDASDGLRSGAYYAVLTIPSDFSAAIVSSGTSAPKQGQLQLESNAAASASIPTISREIAAAAAGSLGNQTTQGYLKNVYDGFNQLAKGNQQAASSAAQLASGTGELADGAASLDDGMGELAGGIGELASGTTELGTAVGSVSAGAGRVASGAAGVSEGARGLDAGASALARSSAGLTRAADDVAAATRAVASGTSRVASADARIAARARTLAEDLRAAHRECRSEGGSVRFCRRLSRDRDRAIALAVGTALGGRATNGLARASGASARGAGALARGTGRVASGARALDRAGGELASASGEVATGAASVASGARELDAAAGQLADAADESAQAASEVADGADSLADSAVQVDDGAASLSSGLAKAAADSPTYSSQQQDVLATTVSQPVVLHDTVQHTSHGNGWLVAAILGTVLWLAALVAALFADRGAIARYAAAPVSSRRLTASQVVPVVGVAVVQALAVVAAVLIFHPSLASLVPLALLCVLAAVVFAVIGVALRLALGTAGVAVFVLLLLVQVAALANAVPLETAPEPLQGLNGIMPLTAFTNGANQLVAGGDVASMTGVVAVLVLWGAAASGAAVAAVKRHRVRPVPDLGAMPRVEGADSVA